MNKKYRPYLKAAKAHGARIQDGKKHLKVYDGEVLVATFSHGSGNYEGRHDMHLIRKAWKQRGWL